MVAAVEPGAHVVAPPFEGERTDVDNVTVTNARARQHPIDAEGA
jgi:hypothetical protein